MLFVFGREVERFIGRRAFIALYLLLLLSRRFCSPSGGSGNAPGWPARPRFISRIFIAFAAIYPNVELFLRIMAKWVALVFVAAYSLQLLAYHGWSELAVLWMSVGLAYGFIQFRGAGPEFAWLTDWTSRWRSKRSLRVVPPPSRAPGRRTGKHLRIDRPGPRQDLEVRHRQPDGERAARARPGAQPAPEQIQVSDPATASLRLSVIVPSWNDHAHLARSCPRSLG